MSFLAAAWFLIQIADTVIPAYGWPESVVGILITVLAIGLIPVLIISWAFEWTPADRQGPRSRHHGRIDVGRWHACI